MVLWIRRTTEIPCATYRSERTLPWQHSHNRHERLKRMGVCGGLSIVLDCKSCGQVRLLDSNSRLNDCLSVLIQHLLSLTSASLDCACTAMNKIVAHIEEPMSTFQVEKKGLKAGGMERQITDNICSLIKVIPNKRD